MIEIALHLYTARLIDRLPCEPRILSIKEMDDYGRAYEDGEIILSSTMPRREWKHTIIHECAHLYDYENSVTPGSIFGTPPFVSSYAATNGREDFAESFTYYYTNKAKLLQRTPEKYYFIHTLHKNARYTHDNLPPKSQTKNMAVIRHRSIRERFLHSR